MTKIIHVVAKDRQNCIGKDNDLAWHIPADLKHFKEITTEGVIVMGRKTFESLGRPLPNRSHHVITRDRAWTADGVMVAYDLTTAINNAKDDASKLGKDSIFILGGGEIYRQSLSLADVLQITEVDLDIQGDTYYPNITDDFDEVWRSDKQTDDKSGISFTFVCYKRGVSPA